MTEHTCKEGGMRLTFDETLIMKGPLKRGVCDL